MAADVSPAVTIHAEQHIGNVEGGRVTAVEAGEIHGNVAVQSTVFIERLAQTIIRRPAEWQDIASRYFVAHRSGLLVVAAVELAFLVLFLNLRNLYLLSLWWGLVVASLLGLSAWAWSTWIWVVRRRRVLLVALGWSTLAAFAVGIRAQQILATPPFQAGTFGIVLAELGEGGDYRRTQTTREISSQIHESLCQTIRTAFAADLSCDPCLPCESAVAEIAVHRVGVVANTETASEVGDRYGAAVVIWGQVLSTRDDAATIRFHLQQTLDRATNPDQPLILYVSSTAAEISSREIDAERDPLTIKRLVAEQSELISSFTFGFAKLLTEDSAAAARHFHAAVDAADSELLDVSPAGRGLLSFYLGRSYSRMGRLDEAGTWFEHARAANPDDPGPALALAHVYASQGNLIDRDALLDEALRLADAHLVLHPDDVAAQFDRGIALQVMGRYEQAGLAFDHVVASDPTFFTAYISSAQVAQQLGQLDRAEDRLHDALDIAAQTETNPASAHLQLGLVYEAAGRPEDARAAYEQAIEQAPFREEIYLYKALLLEKSGETDAALLAYEDLLDIVEDASQQKAWAYGQRAAFHRRVGLLDSAAEDYRRALEIAQDDTALPRSYLAETYRDMGDTEAALREHARSVASAPSGYYPYASFGETLYAVGDLDRSAEMFEAARNRAPAIPSLRSNLATIYARLGRMDDAAAIFRSLAADDTLGEADREAARAALQKLQAP